MLVLGVVLGVVCCCVVAVVIVVCSCAVLPLGNTRATWCLGSLCTHVCYNYCGYLALSWVPS